MCLAVYIFSLVIWTASFSSCKDWGIVSCAHDTPIPHAIPTLKAACTNSILVVCGVAACDLYYFMMAVVGTTCVAGNIQQAAWAYISATTTDI